MYQYNNIILHITYQNWTNYYMLLIKICHKWRVLFNCNPINLQPVKWRKCITQHYWKLCTFVPKIFVCLTQIFSVNATIVKLMEAPPSNCIETTYKDKF